MPEEKITKKQPEYPLPFDCPLNDNLITEIQTCQSCGYWMKDKSYTGCGYSKNSRRGCGEYIVPLLITFDCALSRIAYMKLMGFETTNQHITKEDLDGINKQK